MKEIDSCCIMKHPANVRNRYFPSYKFPYTPAQKKEHMKEERERGEEKVFVCERKRGERESERLCVCVCVCVCVLEKERERGKLTSEI